jgi:hypothetical protein
MKSRNALSAVALTALMAGAVPASAADYDFFYDGSLQAVARLSTTGNTEFTFSFLSAPDAGAFINDILLDMGQGAFTNTTVGTTTPTYSFNAGGYEGTGMQTKISFPMANGAGRLTVGETATWTIAGAFDGPSRLHVNAFIDGQSVKLMTPVPEPESYAMALVALGVLGAYRRFARGRT